MLCFWFMLVRMGVVFMLCFYRVCLFVWLFVSISVLFFVLLYIVVMICWGLLVYRLFMW